MLVGHGMSKIRDHNVKQFNSGIVVYVCNCVLRLKTPEQYLRPCLEWVGSVGGILLQVPSCAGQVILYPRRALQRLGGTTGLTS